MLLSLSYLWFIGVKVSVSDNSPEDFICNKDNKMIVAVYNGRGEAVIQAIDRWGVQRTVYTESCGKTRVSVAKVDEFLRSIDEPYVCELRLVKPWYYAKVNYFVKHHRGRIDGRIDSEALEKNSVLFEGYIEYEDKNEKIIARKRLNEGPSPSLYDFGCGMLFNYIALNGGIENYISKEEIFPQLYPYSVDNERSHNRLIQYN